MPAADLESNVARSGAQNFLQQYRFLSGRTTLDEIALAGTTISKGVVVTLALAAGNRDPRGSPTQIALTPSGAIISI